MWGGVAGGFKILFLPITLSPRQYHIYGEGEGGYYLAIIIKWYNNKISMTSVCSTLSSWSCIYCLGLNDKELKPCYAKKKGF